MTKSYGLNVGGIVVMLDETGKNGEIRSNLHEPEPKHPDSFNSTEWALYESQIDAIESLVLSHACAGVDILSKEYQEGIETTIEAIGNHV